MAKEEEAVRAIETFYCKGHPNIRATHKTTFEITKEPAVTKTGTCIIGVSSDKGARDLSTDFRSLMADEETVLTSVFEVEGSGFTVHSSGSAGITLEDETDMVWRRSNFVCGRTIGIYSDCTASLVPRDIIEKIKKGAVMKVTLTAQRDPGSQLPSIPHLPGIFHSFEESPSRACRD